MTNSMHPTKTTDTASSASDFRKAKKAQRVMRDFIAAAIEIANEKGIGAVSFRSVADHVGYSRSSIYNYFDNLDQLLAFTSINLLTNWLMDVVNILNSGQDAIDRYVQLWKTFVSHAAQAPQCFAYIYDDINMEKIADHLDDYFRVFPNLKSTFPEELLNREELVNLLTQENHALDPCIEDGFFAECDRDELYHFTLLLSNGILWSTEHYNGRYSHHQYLDWFMTYFIPFIKTKLVKEKDLSQYEMRQPNLHG